MKKIIFLTIAYLCMANAYAAYLRNIPMTLNQPDGSVLHCFASGDEYFNYLHDRNGYTIMIHPQTGYYVYAENREGELVATNFIAGVHDPVSNGLEPYALISSEEWMAKRQAWEVPEMRSQNRDFTPNHGTLNNISIFIRFSDEGQFTNSYSSINNMFNNVSAGAVSMRSYFRAASYGAIEIPTTFYPGHNGETIISYQDIYPRSYFKPYNASTNTNGYQSDDERREREFALLERAVNYINNNYPVPSDLNIDYDDDGFVDNVCFIIRGGVGAWNSLLWPHQWELFDKEVYINGKRVWSFNFHLADATSYFNTSTMCHEMNHSLGAPDLYHYYYEKNLYQVGPWDLMHANATPPQHCGAYMKMKYGHWIDEIPEITEAGTYTLNPISSPTPTNVAYKILTDDPNQFYVLEYRDKSSMFETSLPGSGLLIYRINTSYHGNANYNPNEGIYDEVYLFRPGASTTANGSLNKAHHSSDVNRSEFSAATSAYPFFTNGTIDRSIRIYNITNAGNTISFTYGSMSDCEPPTNLIASIEDDDVSLSWNAVDNASSYNIYKNGILIGSTSETTFLDSDLPYGSYAYYVKSVDSQGRRSVPSNSVTFVFDNYDITATAAPAEGGTVEGTGNYNSQTICTLEAMPNYGYIFVNWTENDSVVSTYDTLSFIVTKDRTFTANFQTIDTHWPMPQGYEDNMTITGTVNLDGVESTSDFIELAAFIGEECRGSTLPIKIGGQRVYFLTVAGNAADEGETLNFKLYDHLQQQELDYHCTNELNFQHDIALGLDELYEFNFVSRVQIMATADPEEGGTVSGEGTYYRFDTCSLTATAYTGYTFQNWTLNDEMVSTDTIYTFVVNDSANYVAHFSLNSYNITAITDPDEGGTVSGAGTYYHFDTCSLIATANIGYSFINWTLNDEVVSTDTIYTFVVSDSANYVAHFSLNRYDITVTADPEGSGRLSGAGIYYHFDTCTLTATANMGYTFVNWTENGEVVSTDHTFSFEVSANRQLVANFNQITNHWTAVPGMSSSMTILGVIKIDGVEPFADYLEIGAFSGEECRGSALPQFIMGYCVYSLSVVGNANGDPITFRLYDHHHNKELDLLCTNVLAFADGEFYGSETFYEIDFLSRVQITTIADPAEGGTVEGGTVEGIGEYFFGLQAILTATANTGYTFQNWTLDEVEVTTESTYSFEVSDSANYVAHFSLNSYDVTVTADPDEGGTVTGAGTYTHGTLDTLTAMANMGYYFVNWTENGEEVSTDHTFSFEVTADRQLVANFNQMTNHWTAVSGMPGSMTILGIVKIDGEESFADYIEVGAFCGEECRGTALPQFNEGYCFYSMNVVGNTDGDTITFRLYDHHINQELDLHCTNMLIFTNGEFYDSEVFYEINFISRVQIAATADPTEGGTVEGTGGYFPGLQAILTATANTGYTFQNWTLDEVEVSIDTTYTFEVSDSANYVAHFSLNSYDITASADPDEGGSVNGTGTYYHYDTCTLIATAYTGYTFMNWTLNDEVVSTDTVYAFEVSDTANYVAHFSLNSYDITAIANPDEGGTVSGAGTYYHFDTCSLMATAYTGYTFQNWTLDDEVVSTDTVYTFVVSDSANYVAHFSLNSYDITAIADPDEGGIVSGKGTYYHFDTCTLIASANIGYTFVNWTLGEVEVSTESTYSFEVNGATDYVAHFSLNSYNITATVEPDESGTISGTGIYYHFDTCTLTATANTGYTFQHWTLNDEVISTEAEYTFEVSDSANYVAHFSLNSYYITATAEPDESGTISGAGIYYHFDTCTLTATANMGYTFQNWTLNDEVVSTDTLYTFVVSDTANYVAHFSLNSYNITATTEPDEGGTISGAGIYYHFDTCTLTATAATGYTFQNWTLNDEVVSTDTVYAFEVSDSASYVAHFSLNSYDITATADPDEYGMVSGAGTYYHFDTCTLTATANIGYNLQNWTLNDEVVSTDTVYTFVVSDSANYVAHFSLNSYDITAISDPDEGGTLSGAGTYYHFDTCSLMATSNIGYTFINWTLDDEVVSTDTVYTFEVSDSASYVAHFSLNSYDITATADPEEGGTVSGVGTYYHFDTCSLIATANIGYTFINWTLDDEVVSTDAVYTFEVSGAATYVAHFSNSYEIVAVASPAEGGSVSGTGTYYHFDTCTLTATANMGYTFQNWTLNDEVVSSDTVYTFEVSGAAAYVANFSLNSYYITATADPDEGGTMSGAGTYYHFDTCSLMATANIGYTFINWTLDDEVVSTDTIYTFVVSDSVDYVAHFSLNSYEITATADPDEDGTVSGAGTYYHFDTCTLIATAYTGYTFMNWTLDDEIVSTDAEYTFEVSGAGDYVAHFSNSYEIVALASPVEGGIISGAGTYYHFDTCTLTATANENYLFNSWIVNGETVSTDTIFTFEVTGPMTVTALFYLVQTVELNQGWTWWSTSVEQSGINGLEMLENSLNPYGRVIKNADQFVQYNAILGWVGILNSLNNEAGYRVQTTEACTSSITGPVANSENHPITILPNWTWIGYPVVHQQTVTEALGNYEPQTNDLIKSQNSSARYIDNIGWIPANFSLKPGESYMYYSKALDNKTLVFANGGRGIVENKSDDRYWRNDVHAFADNLCLLAVVEIDGEEQRSEEVELGAFVNGECRGSAKLMYVEHFNRYYAMMNVMGEEGDEVKFALVDRQRNMMSGDSPAHLTFSVNAIVGEFDDPFVVCFGDLTSLDEQAMHLGMYPNPVKCNQTFCILVPQEETVAELTIVNTLGSVVRHETGALNRPVVEGLPVSGVYLVRVVCKSGNVYQNRLVVKQ